MYTTLYFDEHNIITRHDTHATIGAAIYAANCHHGDAIVENEEDKRFSGYADTVIHGKLYPKNGIPVFKNQDESICDDILQ